MTISKKPQPEQNQAPVVQRIRIRYAKRGPLRFTSHRDFARAFERAVRRAGVPIAYSQGFTPHPKISYVGASPTGVASEAEYLELGLQSPVDPEELRRALDASLSPGLDVLAAWVAAPGTPALADQIDASRWRIELDLPAEVVEAAVERFLASAEVLVERMTKQGRRQFDARAAVVSITVARHVTPGAMVGQPCAILGLVVRQVTPSVRPDDVLAGLQVVADLKPPAPARVIRLAQGRLTGQGDIADPLRTGDDVVFNASTAIGESSE